MDEIPIALLQTLLFIFDAVTGLVFRPFVLFIQQILLLIISS